MLQWSRCGLCRTTELFLSQITQRTLSPQLVYEACAPSRLMSPARLGHIIASACSSQTVGTNDFCKPPIYGHSRARFINLMYRAVGNGGYAGAINWIDMVCTNYLEVPDLKTALTRKLGGRGWIWPCCYVNRHWAQWVLPRHHLGLRKSRIHH